MMNEIIQSGAAVLLLRITLILLVGWLVMVLFRFRTPSIAIVTARCLLVAVCVGPLLVFSEWSVPLAVLPVADVSIVPDDFKQEMTRSLVMPSHKISERKQTSDSAIAQRERQKDSGAFVGKTDDAIEVEQTSAVTGIHNEKLAASSDKGSTVVLPFSGEGTAATPRSSSATPILLFSILLLWLAGSVIQLVRLVMRVFRTAGVIGRSESCDERTQHALGNVADRLRVEKLPRVRLSHEVPGPCTVDCFRPIIMLPTQWLEANSQLTELQTEMILAHELTHARWKDAAWDAVGQIARAIWWFHPLAAAVTRQHRLACEHRCDAAASQIAGDVESYRRQLARWALAIRDNRTAVVSKSQQAGLISLSMAERPLMIKRLSWLKTARIEETSSARSRVFVAIAIAVIALLSLTIEPTTRLIAATQDGPVEAATAPDGDGEEQDVAEGHVLLADPKKMAYSRIAKPHLDWDNLVTVLCTVLNEQGDPIEGAIVQLSGLSSDEGDAGHFALVGGTPSDYRGRILVKLPSNTRLFRLQVKADGYATFNNNPFRLADKVEVNMKSGRVVKVRATDQRGELLSDAFPMIEDSNNYGREFKPNSDGVHVSPVVTPDRRWMWVVDGSDPDGPILFSDLIDLADNRSVDESGVRHFRLSQGVQLMGELGEEVPRPIKNGFVHVAVRDGEKHRIESYNRTGLVWYEYTAIEPDGTFVFPSLPRDAHAQVFTICDGWQSSSPDEKSVREYFKKHDAGTDKLIDDTMNRYNSNPQLFHLDSGKSPVRITVPCRESTSLNVRVVDAAGNPLKDAKVSMSPNLSFFGDLVIPGREMWNHELVRNNGVVFAGDSDAFAQFAKDSFLDVKTDEAGLARVRNLPNLRDSFKVTAKGYVMSAYPTSDAEKPRRYGLTGDMVPGEITRRTITMERDLKPIGRELMVVDQDGKPLKDIELTITAIATDSEDLDWQQWSVHRFGAASTGRTNSEGAIRLVHPQQIQSGEVKMLAVRMRGVVGKLCSVNEDLLIPAAPDGHGIRLTYQKQNEAEAAKGRYAKATAEYTDILSGNGASAKEVLQTLLERNDLLSLRQLLKANNYDDVTPLELKPNRNQTKLQNTSAVERVATNKGDRVVVLTSVRPKGATWSTKPRGGSLEAAFIFDAEGKLTGVLGGRPTGDDDIMLTNLGGTFDFFVSVTAFEKHGPHEYASRWYKIEEPDEPALTVYHQASSSSWNSFQGTKFPLAEYCFLGYGLNGGEIYDDATGRNEAGVPVPRSLLWDRPSGMFYGELSQSYEDKPLYKVDVEGSARFKEVSAKPGQVTVTGGRRDFQNWHLWRVVVPEGKPVKAKLELRDADGKTLRVIREEPLAAGQHNLQLQFEDAKVKEGSEVADEERTRLAILVDAKDLRKDQTDYKVPHFKVDESPTLKGYGGYYTGDAPLKIIEKQSTDGSQFLVWLLE